MVTIKLVSESSELAGIFNLQKENLKKDISPAEALSQGFLVADYSLEFITEMNNSSPSVVAVDNGKVIGYALVATQAIRESDALLADLFNQIDKLYYKEKPLCEVEYVVVGQLCVAKQYRGMGMVQQLYTYFKNTLKNKYQYCLTDIASENARSLKAHQKSGFEVIHQIGYGGLTWNIVLWEW